MVRTGGFGCVTCKARRIKCDGNKPGCAKCLKTGRECGGYREHGAIQFRCFTRETMQDKLRKASKQASSSPATSQLYRIGHDNGSASTRSAKSSPSSNEEDDFPESSSGDSSPILFDIEHTPREPQLEFTGRSILALAQQITTPIGHRATCYFLANFVLLPNSKEGFGYMDLVPPLLKASAPGSTLAECFAAASLAALCGRAEYRRLLPFAEKSYVSALRKVTRRLNDPVASLEDSTLVSIILLATFESLLPHAPGSVTPASQLTHEAWASHINGAIQLVRARGKKQFETNLGRHLFVSVRYAMTLDYVAKSKPVLPGVDWWMSQVQTEEVGHVGSSLCLHIAQLRSETEAAMQKREGTVAEIKKVLGILSKAEDLDQQCASWFASMPSTWKPKTAEWIDNIPLEKLSKAEAYPGKVLMFASIIPASLWMNVKSSRLFVWDTIMRCTEWLTEDNNAAASGSSPKSPADSGGDFKTSKEYLKGAAICKEIVADITAATPYFHNWKGSSLKSSNFACGDGAAVGINGLAVMLSLWPMFCGATSDFATESQRRFLQGRIEYVAQNTGSKSSRSLAHISPSVRFPSAFILRDRFSRRRMKPSIVRSQCGWGCSDEAKKGDEMSSPKLSLHPSFAAEAAMGAGLAVAMGLG